MKTMPSIPRLEQRPEVDLASERTTQPGPRQVREIMHREIIVSGDDALSRTIAEELRGAGARIIKINTAADLLGAGVHRARAVVCAGPNDAINLEIALLARQYSPNVRVVARLANDVLREAVAAVNGPGAILDVADLATPSVVEAALSRNAHRFEAAGIEFVVWGAEAPYDGTLREIYADLAPVAVVHGKNSPAPGEVVPCPGRDLQVYAGDWTSMIGVKDELEARGITVPPPTATRSRHSRVRRAIDAARAMRDDVNPMLFPSLAIALLVVTVSTVVVRFSYQNPRMSWLDALWFTSETITTVGTAAQPLDNARASSSGVSARFERASQTPLPRSPCEVKKIRHRSPGRAGRSAIRLSRISAVAGSAPVARSAALALRRWMLPGGMPAAESLRLISWVALSKTGSASSPAASTTCQVPAAPAGAVPSQPSTPRSSIEGRRQRRIANFIGQRLVQKRRGMVARVVLSCRKSRRS